MRNGWKLRASILAACTLIALLAVRAVACPPVSGSNGRWCFICTVRGWVSRYITFSSSSGGTSPRAPTIMLNGYQGGITVDDTPMWVNAPAGPDFAFNMFYTTHSQSDGNNSLGEGWSHGYEITIASSNNTFHLRNPTGYGPQFTNTGSAFSEIWYTEWPRRDCRLRRGRS